MRERVEENTERIIRSEEREGLAEERAKNAFLLSATQVHMDLADRIARLEARTEILGLGPAE